MTDCHFEKGKQIWKQTTYHVWGLPHTIDPKIAMIQPMQYHMAGLQQMPGNSALLAETVFIVYVRFILDTLNMIQLSTAQLGLDIYGLHGQGVTWPRGYTVKGLHGQGVTRSRGYMVKGFKLTILYVHNNPTLKFAKANNILRFQGKQFY